MNYVSPGSAFFKSLVRFRLSRYPGRHREGLLRAKGALALVAALGLSAPILNAATPEIFIDTAFGNSPAGGEIVTGNDDSVPLKNPDRAVVAQGSNSSIVAGGETMGDLRPPYVLFKIGRRANNDAPETALLQWNLIPLGLQSGVYELTAEITPLEDNVVGARLLVGLCLEGGKPLGPDQGMHPSLAPLQFFLSGGKAFFGKTKNPVDMGAVCRIKMRFDLDKRTWSGWINDEEIFTDQEFPPQLADTAVPLQLRDLTFGSTAGMGDKPDASYALAGVKLTKVAD
jgi:hypothetical protein